MENNLLYNDYKLVVTEDGSHSIRFASIDEGYHSTHGAVKEAMHVYILPNLAQHIYTHDIIYVFEMGFGTGLNAYLTYLYAKANSCKIHYTTVEAYPIPEKIYTQLNYPQMCIDEIRVLCPNIDVSTDDDIFSKLHTLPWNKESAISDNFTFVKHHCSIQQLSLPENKYNVIYYDAFAPQFQPELWSFDIFSKLYKSSAEQATLTTYCCKGDVKRALKTAGYTIEKLPGPKGKREMLRATV